MSAPASARTLQRGHIHLPSVHIRAENGGGFDYDEDLYVRGRGRIERIVRLVAIERGQAVLIRETRDELCPDELVDLQESLPDLMDEANPDTAEHMEQRARYEFARQLRISRGEEQVCLGCGCSETRACSGGCLWATERLCSKCIDPRQSSKLRKRQGRRES